MILVAFPFTDLSGTGVRPALLVGRPAGDDVIVAFITSRLQSLDPRAEHVLTPADPGFAATGLRVPSMIRLNKLATLHRRVVRRRLGGLPPGDRAAVSSALRYVFEL